MTASFWLALYRAAWIAFLPPLRLLAAARALPRNWRVTERLDPGRTVPGAGALWMHCASLGEAKGLWALAASLPPDLPLLLTAATSAGADFLSQACAASGVERRARLAPLDHPGLIDAFLERNRIRGLCLYEVELWPNALATCRQRGLPVALAAGRLTPEAARAYEGFGGAAFRLLEGLAWIDAQSEADRARFASHLSVPVHPGADPKAHAYFDVRVPRGNARNAFAFVSLHLAELKMILPVLPAMQQAGEVIVFPRKAAEFSAFAAVLEPLGFARRSREPSARHLLVDGYGFVNGLLPRCHAAFVGGSLNGAGCHNLWEPLAAGCRILLGPDYRHQRALAETLLARGLAEVVADPRRIAGMPAGNRDEACAALLQELKAGHEAALRECRERIIATFFGSAPDPRAAAILEGGEGFST